MLTYSTSLSLYQKLTNNAETANTNLFIIGFNEKIRQLLSKRPWPFLETTKTATTAASTAYYNLPANFKKLLDVYVLIGTTKHIPTEISDRKQWDDLTASSSTSTIPSYFTIIGRQLWLAPTPADTSGTITYRYTQKQKDLTIADYATGTIVSVAAAGTAVVGSGTSWTAKMAGRYIRITDSDTANTGDGEWYRIASVESATGLTLDTPYNGTAITAGSAAYIIGQVSLIPEDYQAIPVYQQVAEYWLKEKNVPLANYYNGLANQLIEDMTAEYASLSTDPVIETNDTLPMNTNLFITA